MVLTDVFRTAVQDAKIGPDKDIPHVTLEVIVGYISDLETARIAVTDFPTREEPLSGRGPGSRTAANQYLRRPAIGTVARCVVDQHLGATSTHPAPMSIGRSSMPKPLRPGGSRTACAASARKPDAREGGTFRISPATTPSRTPSERPAATPTPIIGRFA